MSPVVTRWIEILFDSFYLITIWVIVITMFLRRKNLTPINTPVGKLFLWAFFLLAFGDSGHVGFRLLAQVRGGLTGYAGLIGAGEFATALTVSGFYLLFIEIWRRRFGHQRNLLWWVMIGIGIVRILLLFPTGNQWVSAEVPYGWSLLRNAPLTVLGLTIAIAMLVDAIKAKDKLFVWVALMIFTSYLFYAPVILFVHRFPLLGMLMMPKTVAYVVMAFLALSLFPKKA